VTRGSDTKELEGRCGNLEVRVPYLAIGLPMASGGERPEAIAA
jgi:hypothetical protein